MTFWPRTTRMAFSIRSTGIRVCAAMRSLPLLLHLRPRIRQRHRPVENELARHLSLGDAVTLEEVCPAQTHFLARREAKVALGRILVEIGALDVKLAAKRNLARTGGGVLGIVDGVQLLRLPFGIILDHDLDGPEHRHA